jgi:8-oxo-dGTP pyrophosphatase MutT (NUDIX family)
VRAVDEPVAIYDADGQVTGVAPRGAVYRDGLWHASTGVLVRSGDGERVYLHQRSPEKLIFPGCYDCWAGGVLGPGETPDVAAARELDEELGVRGVPLTPIDRFGYDDDTLRYHVFLYEVRWDGPLRHQPEEVVWGGWVTLQELRDVLADPGRPFAPDGRIGIERWLSGMEMGDGCAGR